jgi:hypothetical protein
MTIKSLFFAFSFLICLSMVGVAQTEHQNPTLNFVGSSPSLTKGTIDTEILTAIIQAKQEEVKDRVFKNTIIKQFRESHIDNSIKNFTTYHYFYELMNIITSGKNKTVITRGIEESTAEFVYVYGLALYIQSTLNSKIEHNFIDRNIINSNKINEGKFQSDTTVKRNLQYFNILIDACYDVILEATPQNQFQFKKDKLDKNFYFWYQTDNVFLKSNDEVIKELFSMDKNALKNIIKEQLNNMSIFISSIEKYDINTYESNVVKEILTSIIKTSTDDTLDISTNNEEMIKFLNSIHHIPNYEKATFLSDNEDIKKIKEDLQKEGYNKIVIGTLIKKIGSMHDTLYKSLQNKCKLIKINKTFQQHQNIKFLLNFYRDISKSNLKNFSLTNTQYEAMKYLLMNFIKVIKNQSDKDIL